MELRKIDSNRFQMNAALVRRAWSLTNHRRVWVVQKLSSTWEQIFLCKAKYFQLTKLLVNICRIYQNGGTFYVLFFQSANAIPRLNVSYGAVSLFLSNCNIIFPSICLINSLNPFDLFETSLKWKCAFRQCFKAKFHFGWILLNSFLPGTPTTATNPTLSLFSMTPWWTTREEEEWLPHATNESAWEPLMRKSLEVDHRVVVDINYRMNQHRRKQLSMKAIDACIFSYSRTVVCNHIL